LKDKQSLLQAWVEAGENVNAVETNLKIQRSQEGELAREKELLTIDEMRARGMSQPLCLKLNNQMLSPNQTKHLHMIGLYISLQVFMEKLHRSYTIFSL